MTKVEPQSSAWSWTKLKKLEHVDKYMNPKFSLKLKSWKVGSKRKKRSTRSPGLCSIQSWRKELSSTDLLGSRSGWKKFFALDFQLCPSLYWTFKIGLNFELDFGLRLGLWIRLRKLWLGLWLGLWNLARTLNWVLTFGLSIFKTLSWTLYWIQEQWLELLRFGDLFDSLEFLLGGFFSWPRSLCPRCKKRVTAKTLTYQVARVSGSSCMLNGHFLSCPGNGNAHQIEQSILSSLRFGRSRGGPADAFFSSRCTSSNGLILSRVLQSKFK